MQISRNEFSGLGRVHDGTLANAIRGIAQDLAQSKIQNAGIADLTDSSTGTAALAFVPMVIPIALYDGTSSGASPAAAFNTAMGKLENAGAVLGDAMNNVRARIGLDIISWAIGTIATPGTIPAQDLALTATSGATSIDFAEGVASMEVARANVRKLVRAFNEIMMAVGNTKVASTLAGSFGEDYVLANIPTASAHATGASSISDTVADAFLLASAANLATLAAEFNGIFAQGAITDLTDSSGGTASDTVADHGTITPYTTAGTDLSPKAGWDTEVAKWRNNIADLSLRTNILLGMNDLALLVDASAGTANTTVEAILVDLTAVTGGGDTGLDEASALATWVAVVNNIATLIAAVNSLVDFYGVEALVDNSTGAADASGDLVVMADSGTGVDGTSLSGVADTEVDANLVVLRNAFACIAGKLNEMTGTGIQVERPLQVVAV